MLLIIKIDLSLVLSGFFAGEGNLSIDVAIVRLLMVMMMTMLVTVTMSPNVNGTSLIKGCKPQK